MDLIRIYKFWKILAKTGFNSFKKHHENSFRSSFIRIIFLLKFKTSLFVILFYGTYIGPNQNKQIKDYLIIGDGIIIHYMIISCFFVKTQNIRCISNLQYLSLLWLIWKQKHFFFVRAFLYEFFDKSLAEFEMIFLQNCLLL